jgi:heterocyst specific transport system permease protein
MSTFVAWRILLHEKERNALAVGGVFIAVVMIFLQLGIYFSIPNGGMVVYDHLRFDLLVASSAYISQGRSYTFPRRRLYQALSVPEVESVSPFYQGEAQWLNDGVRRDVFIMGFKLADRSFAVPDIERQLDSLERPDTVLVDNQTVAMYGQLTPGRLVEIGDRTVEIAGRYSLGTGFVGFGVVIVSDLNFIRIFPSRSLGVVNLGLIRLKSGSDLNQTAERLRQLLLPDTQIFTRPQISALEVDYWTRRTAVGLIFGFGAIVSIVVGGVIVYQTLATQIMRLLPQYATLKAMGYTDVYIRRIVLIQALFLASIAFALAVPAAIMMYGKVGSMARLPVEMTGARALGVLAIVIAMCAGSAMIAVQRVSRVDPADLL